MLQQDIDAASPAVPISILGVNQVGHEVSNDSITADRDIPWLQETVDYDVWSAWGVTYRDVVILGGDNIPVAVFNLTVNDLSVPANYDALRTLLLDVAAQQVP